jgi:hypothetical protein
MRVGKYYLVRRFHEPVEIALAGVTPPPGGGNALRRQNFSPSGGSPGRSQEKKSRPQHPGVAISFDHDKIQKFVKYFS